MGRPGSLAFSFLRGANSDVSHQKGPRMGKARTRARKTHVLKPMPQLHVMYAGTPTSSEMRNLLLNESRPEPSAGRGAFAIVGYCGAACQLTLNAQWLAGCSLN
jgi:hypothetical protein